MVDVVDVLGSEEVEGGNSRTAAPHERERELRSAGPGRRCHGVGEDGGRRP